MAAILEESSDDGAVMPASKKRRSDVDANVGVVAELPPITDFFEGSLISLRVKDFMTFSGANRFHEVRFGPRMNLIAAPNGTGKSSIAAAICLGLAFDHRNVSRGDALASYVNKEEDEALISVTLAANRGATKQVTVERVIGSDGRANHYTINGKVAKEKDVKTLTASLNIDLDNRTQFLSQHKVSEFVAVAADGRKLLNITEGSVLGDEYTTLHDRLINLYKEKESLVQKTGALETSLASVGARMNAMHSDVRATLRQQQLITREKLIAACLAFAQSKAVNHAVVVAQEEYGTARDDMERASVQVAPVSAKLKTAGADYESAKRNRLTCRDKVLSCATKQQQISDKFDVAKKNATQAEKYLRASVEKARGATEAVEEVASELKATKIKMRKAARVENPEESSGDDGEAADLRGRRVMESLKRSDEALRAAKADCDEVAKLFRRADGEFKDWKFRQGDAERLVRDATNACSSALSSTLAGSERVNQYKRMQDAQVALEIYDQVHDKLSGPMHIYGLEISVSPTTPDSILGDVLRYLHWTIGRDLNTFVVPTSEDSQAILHSSQQRRLEIFNRTVCVKPADATEEAVARVSGRYPPEMMADLKQNYGVYGTLLDFVVAPPAVLMALIRTVHMEGIIIGSEKTASSDVIDALQKKYPQHLRRVLTPNVEFEFRGSSYSKQISVKLNDIRKIPRLSLMSTTPYSALKAQSEVQEQRANEELAKAQKELEKVNSHGAKIKKARDEANQKYEAQNNAKNEAQKLVSANPVLEFVKAVRELTAKLKNKKHDIATANQSVERNKKQLANTALELPKLLAEIAKYSNSAKEDQAVYLVASLHESHCLQVHTDLREEMDRLQESIAGYKDAVAEKKTVQDNAVRRAVEEKAAVKEARSLFVSAVEQLIAHNAQEEVEADPSGDTKAGIGLDLKTFKEWKTLVDLIGPLSAFDEILDQYRDAVKRKATEGLNSLVKKWYKKFSPQLGDSLQEYITSHGEVREGVSIPKIGGELMKMWFESQEFMQTLVRKDSPEGTVLYEIPKLEALQRKAAAAHKETHVGQSDALKRYLAVKDEKDTVHAELKKAEERLSDVVSSFQEGTQEYDKKLAQPLKELSDLFQANCKVLGHDGALTLKSFASGVEDPSDFELIIKILIRGNAGGAVTLSGLSGGEQSLTTMIFILTLQQIGMHPFTLVDEINQGLDRRRETHLFHLMLKLSANSFRQSVQITPKMRPDLIPSPPAAAGASEEDTECTGLQFTQEEYIRMVESLNCITIFEGIGASQPTFAARRQA